MANKIRPIIDDSNGNVGISTLGVPTSKLQVGGNVVPDLNVSYSLGLPNAQWSSSYVYNSVNSIITASIAIRAPLAALNTISSSAITTSVIQFVSASTPPYVEGAVFYDWAEHALSVYDDNNQVTHNLGQENLMRVYNPMAGALPTGMPVYISESNAGFPKIWPAIAASSGSTFNVAGVTNGYISGSSYGYITTVGVVHGLTQSFAAGTPLWLSTTNSGSYTTIMPTALSEKVLVGYIIQSGSITGTDLLVLPNPHTYGSTNASYAVSASRAEFSQQASSSIALLSTNTYLVKSITAPTSSLTGSFKGYLSGSATSASYVATCSVAILAYASQTSDFALDSTFAYSASYASTCSVFVTTYETASVYSSSFASQSISASYVPTGRSMVLCAAYTPVLAGPDVAEYVFPYGADGTTMVWWNIKRFTIRAQLPESTQTVVNIEKSTGAGIFNPIIVGSVTLPATAYEATSGSAPPEFSASTGDKIRFNVATLGTAQNWTIITEISNA
jgi:hypothetical protein